MIAASRKKRVAESRAGMIVTTIALPAELHKRLAIAGVETNTAATEIVRRAIEAYLDSHDRKLKAAGTPRR